MKLGWWEVVVFDRIARSEHPCVLETGNLPHGLELNFFGEGGREAVDIGFNGVSAFGFDENLVAVFVRKAVDLVFYAGAVPGPFSLDGT